MPNIKSAKKRVSLSRAANEKNKMEKSVLKTTIKKFDAAVAAGDKTRRRRTPPSPPLLSLSTRL